MRTRVGEILTATIAAGGLILGVHGVARIVGEYAPARIKYITCALDNPVNYIELCAEDRNSFTRKEDILGSAVLELATGSVLINAGSVGYATLRDRRANLEGGVW